MQLQSLAHTSRVIRGVLTPTIKTLEKFLLERNFRTVFRCKRGFNLCHDLISLIYQYIQAYISGRCNCSVQKQYYSLTLTFIDKKPRNQRTNGAVFSAEFRARLISVSFRSLMMGTREKNMHRDEKQ